MPRLENPQDYVKASTRELLDKAQQVCTVEFERCQIFHASAHDAESTIPEFDTKEVKLARVVGRGGFCVIRELASITLTKGTKSRRLQHSRSRLSSFASLSSPSTRGETNGDSAQHQQAVESLNPNTSANVLDTNPREFLARRVWSNGGKYVVKQVNPDLLHTDRLGFLTATIDLVLEARFLANLSHPNVIGIRGLSATSPFETPDYFLILDQLKDTLPKRLNAWMQTKRATSGITGLVTRGKRKVALLLINRLLVAHDIAEAMDYIHSRNIIYRDLKPDNIGFDDGDMVKLFDFGLAKELLEEERDVDGLYRMTGFSGSIRYMAPEVGLKMPYNLLADVYSWGMIMWYIMALEPPMLSFTPNMFMSRVFLKGYRPLIKDKWPPGLGNMMKACWSENISERPSFAEVVRTLRAEATKLDPELSGILAGDEASRSTKTSTTREIYDKRLKI